MREETTDLDGACDGAAPEWFTRALEAPRAAARVSVEGASVHYFVWGERGRPGIVLIHGSSAHAHWWAFLAPLLAREFRVAAIDLSGNGDSDWRSSYSSETFAAEVMAVAEDAALGPNPYVVGHSFGGFVALTTGVRYGSKLGGTVLVDSSIRPPSEEAERWARSIDDGRRRMRRSGPTRVYADFEEACSRFRLSPPQPCENGYVLDYVARHSLRPVEGGWTWKFDPGLFENMPGHRSRAEQFDKLACRAGVIHGEWSDIVSSGSIEYMRELGRGRVPIIGVPEARHHVMLDQPLAFVTGLRGLLHSWEADGNGDIPHFRPQR